MRTTDFSKAPKQARAEALVVVEFDQGAGTRSGVLVGAAARENRERSGNTGVFGITRGGSWLSFRSMRPSGIISNAPGYVWHKTFWRGAHYGAIVFFETLADAEHYRDETSGFSASARVLVAEPSGYSNGVWRAEGNVMAHIEHFTPTSIEAARGATPPLVATPGAVGAESGTDSGDLRRAARAGTRAARAEHDRRDPGRGDENGAAGPSRANLGATDQAPASVGNAGRGAPDLEEGRSVTDAAAMFVGATKYRGPRALITLSRTWYPMIARMQKLHGYVWHTVYWEPPFTLGTLAFFATRDDLLAFARLPAHRTLMQWITRDTKNGTGGYIRLHTAPEPPRAGSGAGAGADVGGATAGGATTQGGDPDAGGADASGAEGQP